MSTTMHLHTACITALLLVVVAMYVPSSALEVSSGMVLSFRGALPNSTLDFTQSTPSSTLSHVTIEIAHVVAPAPVAIPLVLLRDGGGGAAVLSDVTILVINVTMVVENVPLVWFMPTEVQWIRVRVEFRDVVVTYRGCNCAGAPDGVLLHSDSLARKRRTPSTGMDGDDGSSDVYILVSNATVSMTAVATGFVANSDLRSIALSVVKVGVFGNDVTGSLRNLTVIVNNVAVHFMSLAARYYPASAADLFNLYHENLNVTEANVKIERVRLESSSACTSNGAIMRVRILDHFLINVTAASMHVHANDSQRDGQSASVLSLLARSLMSHGAVWMSDVVLEAVACGGRCPSPSPERSASPWTDRNISFASVQTLVMSKVNREDQTVVQFVTARVVRTTTVSTFTTGVFDGVGQSGGVSILTAFLFTNVVTCSTVLRSSTISIEDAVVVVTAMHASLMVLPETFCRVLYALMAVISMTTASNVSLTVSSSTITLPLPADMHFTSGDWVTKFSAATAQMGSFGYELVVFLSTIIPFAAALASIHLSLGLDPRATQSDIRVYAGNCSVNVAPSTQALLLDSKFLLQSLNPTLYGPISPLAICVALISVSWNATNVTIQILSCRVDGGSVVASPRHEADTLTGVTMLVVNTTAGALMQSATPKGSWVNSSLTVRGCALGLRDGSLANASVYATRSPSAAVYGLLKDGQVFFENSRLELQMSVMRNFQTAISPLGVRGVQSSLLIACNTFCPLGVSECSPLGTRSPLLGVNETIVVSEAASPSDAFGNLPLGEASVAGIAAGLLPCARAQAPPAGFVSMPASVSVATMVTALFPGGGLGSSVVFRGSQMALLRRSNGGSAACDDGGALDDTFLADPVNNPMQLSLTIPGLPIEAAACVGAAVGCLVLLIMAAAANWMLHIAVVIISGSSASASMFAVDEPWAGSLLRLATMAWRHSGGFVSSYIGAYAVLQPPLLTCAAALMTLVWRDDLSEVAAVAVVTLALLNAAAACGPAALWSTRILYQWPVASPIPPFAFKRQRVTRSLFKDQRRCVAPFRSAAKLLSGGWMYLPGKTAAQRHVKPYLEVIDPYWPWRRWYFMVDFTCNAAAGIVGGIGWGTAWCGSGPMVAAVVLSVLPVVCLLVLRPMHRQLEMVSGAVLGSLSAAVCVLELTGLHEAANTTTSVLLVGLIVCGFGVTIAQFGRWLYNTCMEVCARGSSGRLSSDKAGAATTESVQGNNVRQSRFAAKCNKTQQHPILMSVGSAASSPHAAIPLKAAGGCGRSATIAAVLYATHKWSHDKTVTEDVVLVALLRLICHRTVIHPHQRQQTPPPQVYQ